jgi:hypothetical protein
MEGLSARLIKLAFFLFCLAAVQVILVLFVSGFTPESKSKLKALLGNLIVLLPFLAVLPSWLIGVPPAPRLEVSVTALCLPTQARYEWTT